jgi:hypothetical protein
VLLEGGTVESLEFGVEEGAIEGGVVNDDFGIAHKLEQVVGDLLEARFVGEKFFGESVDFEGVGVAGAVRVEVGVVVLARQPAVEQFDSGNFDDAVAAGGIEAGGLGVEDDLACHAGWVSGKIAGLLRRFLYGGHFARSGGLQGLRSMKFKFFSRYAAKSLPQMQAVARCDPARP